MEITKLTAFIFSPTGTTAAVAKPLAEALLPGAHIVDLTCADAEEERFGPDELVLFAAPVYGGRIPAPAAKRFARMKGTDTPALLVAVYGNRDYDDALLELCDLAEENGFRPAGARRVNGLMLSVAEKPFAKKNSLRREPEWVL